MSNTTKRVKEIRRKTRRKFSSEEKIRIVLEGLRGESRGRAGGKGLGSDHHKAWILHNKLIRERGSGGLNHQKLGENLNPRFRRKSVKPESPKVVIRSENKASNRKISRTIQNNCFNSKELPWSDPFTPN